MESRTILSLLFTPIWGLASLSWADTPRLKEVTSEFWIHRLDHEQLLFNAPWDAESGESIQRDQTGMPPYAISCREEALKASARWFASPEVAALWLLLYEAGAPRDVLVVVNVLPEDLTVDRMKRIDRDAYFWLWPRRDMRPTLSLTNFRQGTWVWEVLAAPSSCVQPDPKEATRYLTYAGQRLR